MGYYYGGGGGDTYKKHLHKLDISQKKPLRICNRAMHNEPSSPLFKKCNILKLQNIYKLQCCKLMYEFLKNNLPTPIMNIFTVNSDIHGHNTRQLNDVHLPKVKTDIVKRSYLCNTFLALCSLIFAHITSLVIIHHC